VSWSCQQVNPTTGAVIPGFSDGLNGGVTMPRGFAVVCTAQNETSSLSLVKHVINDNGGTATAPSWNLTAAPTGTPPAGLGPQTVAGSETVTPANTIFVRPGQPYTLTETGVPGYTLTGISCVTSTNPTPRAVTSITLAVGESGVCTYTNDDQPGSTWVLSKTSDPQSGDTVKAGDTITYTLTAANVGPVAVTDGMAHDDLSAVMPYATLEQTGLGTLGLSYDSTTHILTWTVPTIPVGGSVSVQYTVTVNVGVAGVVITNLATPTVPNGSCVNATDCRTTHPVPQSPVPVVPPVAVVPPVPGPPPAPDLHIAMTASVTSVPESGSFRYDIAVTNVSTLGVAYPVTLSDPIPSTLKVPGSRRRVPAPRTGRTARSAVSAPVIGLAATVASPVSGQTISNTATTCWLNPSNSADAQRCAASTVVVTVTHAPTTILPVTGVAVTEMAGLALVLLLGGGLLVTTGTFWPRRPRRH
jgi:large repetitive protein